MDGSPAESRRSVFPTIKSVFAATAVALILGFVFDPTTVIAATTCTDDTVGWCLAQRIVGDVPGGELGFRFGEPLDVDGDGRADVAAGARFKLQADERQNGDASVWSGATGRRIRSWDGTERDGLFGHWVLPVADIDGDGLADVVVSAPNAGVGETIHGTLTARSPKTGETIWRVAGTREENFGWDLALADDYDGDGHRDLFVGAPSTAGGRVYVVSAKTGATLERFAPSSPPETFGWYVARLDDLDGDGKGELAVGAHLERTGENAIHGAAYVFSTRSGAAMRRLRGMDHLSGFGEVVAAIGDLDADGHGELVVAAPRTNDHSRTRPGDVYVYSGTSGAQLRHWSGKQPGELFGRMVVGAGDVNGDGVEDLAVGAPWYRGEPGAKTGRVEIRSGSDGEVIGEMLGEHVDAWFGWHIRRAPDPKGEGRPALLIAALRQPVDGHVEVGELDLYVLQSAKPEPAAPVPPA